MYAIRSYYAITINKADRIAVFAHMSDNNGAVGKLITHRQGESPDSNRIAERIGLCQTGRVQHVIHVLALRFESCAVRLTNFCALCQHVVLKLSLKQQHAAAGVSYNFV